MADRFTNLYDLKKNLYCEGSPIIISAGSLLKDNISGSIIAQLKYQSVSEKAMIAVILSLTAYDISGNSLDETIEYQYLDMNVCPGEVFGAKKAIVLPNPVSRSFSINEICVVFEDRSEWKLVDGKSLQPLPSANRLTSALENKLVGQYKLEVNDSSEYIPTEHLDMWMCSCGTWCKEDCCYDCHSEKKIVFDSLNVDYLNEKYTLRMQKEAEEAEAKRLAEIAKQEEQARIKAEEDAIAREKWKKIRSLITAAGIIAIIAVAVALVFSYYIKPHIIIPREKYKQGETYLSEGDYVSAKKVFMDLGDYKDAPIKLEAAEEGILEDKYQNAKELLESKDYDEAFDAFSEIIEYKDSKDQLTAVTNGITERDYQKALNLKSEGKFQNALDAFTALEDYKDSKDQAALMQQTIDAKDTISIILSIMGKEATEKSGEYIIAPSDAFLDISDNAELFGFFGSIVSTCKAEPGGRVWKVEWVSNKECTEDDFKTFLEKMSILYDGVNSELEDGSYILDISVAGDVFCRYESKTMFVTWKKN